ncbi:QueT transporter family protein [Levilactobacillus suantsaii]|nr:QueT transporter family protein [Levilactobacillus suantsaii]
MQSKKSFFGIDSPRDMVLAALVAALYVVVTMALPALSYGVVQVRFSEMFNHLVSFNRRYIVAVTLGVFIANIFGSSLGLLDVVTGTVQTLLALLVMVWLGRYVPNKIGKLALNTVVAVFFMCMIAWEYAFIAKTAFWPTFWANWFTIGAGELVSMVVGGLIVYLLSLKLDFTK